MKTQVLIIGGGTAGIMTAARLRKADQQLDISILEPSEKHYYQAAWTLVGAGTFNMKATERLTVDFIPNHVKWIKDKAIKLSPENNEVISELNGVISYDYLIVATGLVMRLDLLPGLKEALATPMVCSNYLDPEKTWQVLQNFKGGNAVFTQPSTPIKCGGGPMKIMFLAQEYFRKSGVRDNTNVIYATPGSVIFGVKEFAKTLMDVVNRNNIVLRTYYSPIRIDAEKKQIFFKYTFKGENGCVINEDKKLREHIAGESEIMMEYDMLHLAPPQSAPAFVSESALAHQEGPSKGWMNVDINTLQSKVFANVYGLGDVVALPTAKTGAAIRKQTPVLVKNLLNQIRNKKETPASYEGYSSCPLVTGYGKMVLAEFKYDNVRDSDKLISTFVDTTKEQWSMWLLKKFALPWLYWNKMLKGKM